MDKDSESMSIHLMLGNIHPKTYILRLVCILDIFNKGKKKRKVMRLSARGELSPYLVYKNRVKSRMNIIIYVKLRIN